MVNTCLEQLFVMREIISRARSGNVVVMTDIVRIVCHGMTATASRPRTGSLAFASRRLDIGAVNDAAIRASYNLRQDTYGAD
jgi:hypothetical protein